MPAPAQVESPVAVAKVPRGLEGIRPAELAAHLESGRIKAAQLSRVASSSDKMQTQLGKRVLEVATKVKQTEFHPGFKKIYAERVAKNIEINQAKKDRKKYEREERILTKSKGDIAKVEAVKAIIEPDSTVKFSGEAAGLKATVSASIEKASESRIHAGLRESKARGEKRALNYGKALGSEIGKIPTHITAGLNKIGLESASRLADQVAEELPTYYAGQEVLVQRIQEQVKPDNPIEDSFYESAKALRKAVKATRKEEMRLARKIDKVVKNQELKKGRLAGDVRGEHVAEDLAIENRAQQILDEMYQGVEVSEVNSALLTSATDAAANRVRQLIEKPAGLTGFLKKPLQDSLLTTKGLKEAIKAKDIVDPARKLVYGAMSGKQKSIEDVLGCEISMTRDGKERLIAIKLPQEEKVQPISQERLRRKLSREFDKATVGDGYEGYENNIGDYEDFSEAKKSNLFASLVKAEFAEDGLRRKLSEVESGNIIEVRILTKALEKVGKERAKNLKLANAKINSINTADGVRTGAIRTRLADVGVKAGEAGIATGIAAGATYLGVHNHIEAAQSVVAKANTLIAPLREAIQNGPDLMRGLMESLKGVDLNMIQTAIQSGSTSELFQKAKPFIEAFNKVQALTSKMNLAPEQINAITQGALKATASEQAGAMKDLIIGSGATAVTALSFTEGIRKIAGAPGRGIRSLYHHFFS